jgi:ankyrin repeat protein
MSTKDTRTPINDGVTPLYTAAQNGQVEVIKMLVSLGANVNAPNNLGATPVYVAAGNGHAHVIEALAELGADLHKPTHNGTTPLYAAAHEGQEGTVRALLKLGVDPNAPNLNGITPLYIAAQEGHESVIRALAELGATINAAQHHTSQFDSVDDSCPPPVYIAAQEGHVEAVRTLVAFGGDVNVCRFDGSTPLHVAAAANQLDVVLVLTELGADVHGTTFTGSTPLHLAAQEGHAAVIRALVQVGADVDATDDKACTAAHVAAALGHVDVLSAIIDMRGDVEILNGNGRSPLMTAAAGNHRGAFLTLVDAGVDVRQCYFSQDQSVAAFTAEIKTMVDDNSWSHSFSHIILCGIDAAPASLMCLESLIPSHASSAGNCCVFSLAKLIFMTYKTCIRGLQNEDSDITSIGAVNESELTLLLLREGSPSCLRRLLRDESLERLQNVAFGIRRRLVRVACIAHVRKDDSHIGVNVVRQDGCRWNQYGEYVRGLNANAKLTHFVEIVTLFLDSDMLRDVLALRLTCKSNSERRRFPVLCLSCYVELESNLIEEWLSHGVTRFLSTNVIHGALVLHQRNE